MAESSSPSSSSSSSPLPSTVTTDPPKRQGNSSTQNPEDIGKEPIMAEDTTRTTSGPASGKSSVTSTAPDKQRIRASSSDNVLEPDAMRGSEQHLRDVDVEDEEEARRDVYRNDDEKKARQDELKAQADSRERRAKARENQ